MNNQLMEGVNPLETKMVIKKMQNNGKDVNNNDEKKICYILIKNFLYKKFKR